MSMRGALSTARARLRSDERGFSLIEVMVAITVIFGSLTALAYTATIGFDHIGFARERQAGTGLANRLMEEVRGLAYERIQQGMLTSDVTADPNVVTGCGGDAAGVYRFESCSGEKIVHASGLAAAAPLVPNNGTISAGYPIPYSYRVYVTNNDTSKNAYRVTVLVSWDSRRFSGAANEVQTQTMIFSPTGCVSSSTHPFAAPCQPFFFGQALSPTPTVTITGTAEGVSFDSALIHGPSAEANVQIEQVAQIQSSVQMSGVQRTVSGTLTSAGGTTAAKNADNDPSTSTGEYNVDTSVSGTAGSLTAGSGANTLVVSNGGSGDAGSVASAALASATAPCPPSATESDQTPCGHSSSRQQNAATAVLTLADVEDDVNLGTTTLARFGPPGAGNPTTAFSDRELGSGGTDGRLEQSASRILGTVNIGGLPSAMTPPANWSGANAWNGYLVSLVSYQDSVSAQAGTNAPAPTASRSGTIYYWNGSGYSSVAIGAAGTLTPSVSVSQTVDGNNVTVSVSGSTTPASNVTSSTPSGGGSITRNDVRAEAGSPLVGTFTYTVTVDGTTVANLSVAVNLGNLTVRGTYEPAPSPV